MHLSSLNEIHFGDWSIKASSFDDQIIMLFHNEHLTISFLKVFYCEEKAFQYVSCFLEDYYYEKNYKIS